MVKATVRLENVALKWRALAERRRDHHLELYKSGRWKHYYTEQEFLAEMRNAIAHGAALGEDRAAPGRAGAAAAAGAPKTRAA